jgi:thiamine pyrophosphate-dependent acetolactate synthase large subunit-like protein
VGEQERESLLVAVLCLLPTMPTHHDKSFGSEGTLTRIKSCTRYLNNAEKVAVMCSGGVYHAKYAFARVRERVGWGVAPTAEIFAFAVFAAKQNS